MHRTGLIGAANRLRHLIGRKPKLGSLSRNIDLKQDWQVARHAGRALDQFIESTD